MASWQTDVVATYLRLTRRRRYLTEEGGRRLLAERKGPLAPPRALTRRGDLEVERGTVGGRPLWTVRPRPVREGDGAVLYLHGGAYVSETAPQHWALVADLARATGRPVHLPSYGLAPAHTAVEAEALLHALVPALRDQGVARVHVAGDSAGGGLALALAQAWDPTWPELAGLTLVAPWLDLTLSHPSSAGVEPVDPWLARAGLRPAAAAWAGGLALDDPRVSPGHGPLDGLPVVDLYAGTRDIAWPDARDLARRLERLGPGRVRYHEEPGGLHVTPLLPTPEGRRARRELVAHIVGTVGTVGGSGTTAP